MKKDDKRGFDAYMEEFREIAKGAPEPEEILAQFEKGDYSSLDPEFLNGIHDCDYPAAHAVGVH